MATRRALLAYFMAAALCGGMVSPALADDSDGGSGNSGSGSSNSGSGSSGSGSDDHDDNDSDNDNDSSGSGSGGSDDSHNDDDDDDEQTHARKAVERGEAMELKKVLTRVNRQYPGRVVSVSLVGKGRSLSYRIKVIDKNNRLLNLVVNARNGSISRAD